MLKLIAHRVLGFSAQERISKAMLSNGINLRPDGCYYCGPVVLADVAFAAAIGVDRRSLRRFAKKVLRSPELRSVYCNIEKTVSPVLLKSEENGLVRLWAFAKKPGIIANVARLLSEERIVILQLVADNPLSVRDPKLVIVTDGKISPLLAGKLARLPNVKKVRCA